MRICVITSYYCKVVVGLEAQFCTLLVDHTDFFKWILKLIHSGKEYRKRVGKDTVKEKTRFAESYVLNSEKIKTKYHNRKVVKLDVVEKL